MNHKQYTLAGFLYRRANELEELGRETTAGHYKQTARLFSKRLEDVRLKNVNSGVIAGYRERLLAEGLDKNTVAFYLRTMRAAYNRAIALELVKDNKPFTGVRCATMKTRKRALTEHQLKAIAELELQGEFENFARDFFLLSYMLRGMAPVDLTKLKWSDINNGRLDYRRSKTSQSISIRICKPIEDMLKKIGNKDTERIFPQDAKSLRHRVNDHLHRIGGKAKIPFPLTMYVARHTWASLAQTKNVPLAVISKGLGHDNMMTTEIYLSGIENCVVDRYNRNLISIIAR